MGLKGRGCEDASYSKAASIIAMRESVIESTYQLKITCNTL